jgi:hypothetical protein
MNAINLVATATFIIVHFTVITGALNIVLILKSRLMFATVVLISVDVLVFATFTMLQLPKSIMSLLFAIHVKELT